MRNYLLACCVALLCTISAALAEIAKPSSIDDTLALMAEAFTTQDGVVDSTIDAADQSVLLTLSDDQKATAYPDNLHAKLLSGADDADRQAIFDHHITVTMSQLFSVGADPSPIDHPNIFPVLRHSEYRAFIENKDPERAMVTSGSIGDTEVLYVLDTPESVSFLLQDDLAALNLNMDSLDALARTNLQRISRDLQIEGEDIYLLTLDGFYDSSLLLDDALWASVRDQVGDVLLAMPNRDLVIFVPADVPDAEQILRGIIRDYGENAPYPLSDNVFQRVDGAWITLP